MGVFSSATGTKDVPEEIMQLTWISQSAGFGNKHQRFVNRLANANVLVRGNLAAFKKLSAEISIANVYGAYS